MSLPEVSTPELILQYNAAKQHVKQALIESRGERTPKVLHLENVGLRLLLQLKDREIATLKDKQVDEILSTSMHDREIQQLKAEVKIKQDEILRLAGILENRKWVEESRKDWRARCLRAEKAVRSANHVRDEYYRALIEATSHRPPPSSEELHKSFGEPEKKQAWSDKWPR